MNLFFSSVYLPIYPPIYLTLSMSVCLFIYLYTHDMLTCFLWIFCDEYILLLHENFIYKKYEALYKP